MGNKSSDVRLSKKAFLVTDFIEDSTGVLGGGGTVGRDVSSVLEALRLRGFVFVVTVFIMKYWLGLRPAIVVMYL